MTPIHLVLLIVSCWSLTGCGVVAQQSEEKAQKGDVPRDTSSVPRVREAQHSLLWGENGEQFDPKGRLPDFSFAGYEFGDKAIPEYRTVARVTDFGASGSDTRDDTDAFRRAIATVQAGSIEIPAGEYYISDIIDINKPNIALKGVGSGECIIHITSTLDARRRELATTGDGKPVSRYSWSGGFFWVKGKLVGRTRFEIIQPAERGDRRIRVSEPGKFAVGDRIEIEQQGDPQGGLLSYLYAGQPGDTKKLSPKFTLNLFARVESIVGDVLVINRPLPWDVRSSWTPTARVSMPTVHHVGIEGLTIRFPTVPYNGHFTEEGRNAIAFNGTTDCWVRDVVIENCDSGIFFMGVHGTMDGVTIRSARSDTRGRTGHHGLSLGSDNLLMNFNIQTEFFHDITLTRLSSGNVVKNGRAQDITFDHHKSANFGNLFCNIDAGKGSRVWASGGAASLGKHTGAWSTFWAIQSDQPIQYPPREFAPDLINLVGVQTNQAGRTASNGVWFEVIDPDRLEPKDLHQAQRDRRLGPRP